VAIQDQPDESAKAESTPEQSVAPMKLTDESRRRFTKAGLAASGVILTVVSQPGMASTVCASPSGSLSGGLQSHQTKAVTCSGLTPGYWKNHLGNWPNGCSKQVLFRSVFNVTSSSSIYYPPTLLEVLTPQDFKDQQNFGMHLVAAYLNAMAGLTSFLPVATLQNIFSEWETTGYYTPTAGVKWDLTQIVNYLLSIEA
jgi:hypothetical protein